MTRNSWVGFLSGQRDQTVNLTAQAFEGSNPSPTMRREHRARSSKVVHDAGVAQLVERKPSKLDVAGSSPVSRSSQVWMIAKHEVKRSTEVRHAGSLA